MPKRIAIVEDEAELASLIEYNLTRQGFTTQILNGTQGTLKSLEQMRPACAGPHPRVVPDRALG